MNHLSDPGGRFTSPYVPNDRRAGSSTATDAGRKIRSTNARFASPSASNSTDDPFHVAAATTLLAPS
jgi:hypothetical protein